MQKLGWFGGLGVTQGHQKHSHSIEHLLDTYLILDEVGLSRQMSFSCPTRCIDLVGS